MGLLDGLFTNANTGGGNALGVPVTIAADGLFNDADTKDAGAVLVTVPTGRTITGRRRFTGMQADQTWQNLGPGDLVLRHNDSGVAASDRIVSPTGADYVVRAGKAVKLIDDVAASRTRIAISDAETAARADAATTITGITIAAAVALMSTFPLGSTIVCNGRNGARDGGHAVLNVVSGTASVDNVFTYASTGGRALQRAFDGTPVSAVSVGLVPGAMTGNRAALQNVIDVAGEIPGFVLDLVPHGAGNITTYPIEGPVYFTPRAGGMTIRATSQMSGGNSKAFLLWVGPSDTGMFHHSGTGCTFDGFDIVVSSGYTLRQGVDFHGSTSKGGLAATQSKFCNMRVSALGTGVLHYGFTCDFDRLSAPVGKVAGIDYSTTGGNCDHMQFHSVFVTNFQHTAFSQRDAQPYDWKWIGCRIEQNGLPQLPRGVAFWADVSSASGCAIACFFYNIECRLVGGGSAFEIISPNSELEKKWYYSPYSGFAPAVRMSGGRATGDAFTLASSGPIGFAADDVLYVNVGNAAALTLDGVFCALGSTTPGKISLSYGASLNVVGGVFPGEEWVQKGADPQDGTVRGGVYARGHRAIVNAVGYGQEYRALPELRGALNGTQVFRIPTGSAVSYEIPLPRAETDARYVVTPSIEVLSGSYVPTGPVLITNKQTRKFTVVLPNAPTSAELVLSCDIHYPESARRRSIISGATDFSETAILRSTSNAGPVTPSTGFAFEALVALDTPLELMAGSGADNSAVFATRFAFGSGGLDMGLIYSGGVWRWYVRSALSDASAFSPAISNAQVGRLQHFVARYTGAVLSLWSNGVLLGSVTTSCATGTGQDIAVGNSIPYPTILEDGRVTIYAVGACSTVPSDADIAARFAAVKAADTLPATWPGQTLTHRYLIDGRATITNDAPGGADPLTLRLVSDGSLTTSGAPTIVGSVPAFLEVA